MSPEELNQLKASLEDVRKTVNEIKIALTGDIEGRPGLLHTTRELHRAVFHDESGLIRRVEALERYKGETKARFDGGVLVGRMAITAVVVTVWELGKEAIKYLLGGKHP